MKDRFIMYALRFGKRRSQAQKRRFLSMLSATIPPTGYGAEAQTFKLGMQMGRNVVIGDLASADVVYMADYDTKERILDRKYKYHLLDNDKNLKALRANILIFFVLSVAVAAVAIAILYFSFQLSGFLRILVTALAVLLGLVSAAAAKGFPAKYNFKKFSAMYLLFELMTHTAGKRCCFVFTDFSTFTGIGRNMFFEANDLKGKRVIFLEDCCTPGKTACLYVNAPKKDTAVLGALPDLDIIRESEFAWQKERGFAFFLLSHCTDGGENDLYVEKCSTNDDLEFDEDAYEKMKRIVYALDEQW